jgi:hypothetical protein
VIFNDDYLLKKRYFFLKTKNEASIRFKTFKQLAENIVKKETKTFKIDLLENSFSQI